MKRLTTILFLSLLLPLTVNAKEIVSQVAAVVNNQAITTIQLANELKPLLSETERRNGPLSSIDRDALERKTLDNMIEQELIRQQAERIGIKVTEPELSAAIDDVLNQNNKNKTISSNSHTILFRVYHRQSILLLLYCYRN